jgi:stage II sporulation protein D
MKHFRLINCIVLAWILLPFLQGCGRKATVSVPRTPLPAPSSKTTPQPKEEAKAVTPSAPPISAKEQTPPSANVPPAITPEVSAPSLTLVSTGPTIRIGLTTSANEVRISSSAPLYFVEKIPEVSRQLANGDIQVRIEREVEESDEIFRIQVGAFSNPDSAEELRSTLAARFAFPVVVRENPANQARQVRIGEFPTRKEAQDFASGALAEAGYRNAFVVREATSTGGGQLKLALRGSENLFRINQSGYVFYPASAAEFLRLDGKPYRGALDLLLNKDGKITVVNQLGMEEYLLGVVPAELSPKQFPELAALEAQAVAARTYALKNMGKFNAAGFDLTADARTQVYGGVSGEQESANEAVKRTAGVAVYYQNKFIDAMYMSTCGGKTEDFAYVFDAAPVPYLKSVYCTVESELDDNLHQILPGNHLLDSTVYSDDGSIANRNLELAASLGLIGSERFSADYLNGAVEESEVQIWVERARKLAKRDVQAVPSAKDQRSDTRAEFLQYAAERFFGSRDIDARISATDADYYMENLKDGNTVPEGAQKAIAYVMQAGLWRPYPDNSVRANEPIRRLDTMNLLAKWIEASQPQILQSGAIASLSNSSSGNNGNGALTIKWGNRTQQFQLAAQLRLFRLAGGQSAPADSLHVIGNEKVMFRTGLDGKIDFLEVELNPTGASSDRFSPLATWKVTMARSAIDEKLHSLAPKVGEIQDLKPSRIGNSGRAVRMQIIGSRGSTEMNGYSFRNALGLRDTLFTITRAQNPDGSVASFTFNGRGWGHGVGMCQVGAFGMARAGKSYEEILKTYYQGVEIRKAY